MAKRDQYATKNRLTDAQIEQIRNMIGLGADDTDDIPQGLVDVIAEAQYMNSRLGNGPLPEPVVAVIAACAGYKAKRGDQEAPTAPDEQDDKPAKSKRSAGRPRKSETADEPEPAAA